MVKIVLPLQRLPLSGSSSLKTPDLFIYVLNKAQQEVHNV